MAQSSHTSETRARKLSSSALRLSDEFRNLKDVHLAVVCLQGLLSPIHRAPDWEQFSIEPAELRALLGVVNAEMERRTEPVDAAIRSLHKAVKKLKTAEVEAEPGAEGRFAASAVCES